MNYLGLVLFTTLEMLKPLKTVGIFYIGVNVSYEDTRAPPIDVTTLLCYYSW